MTQPSTITPSTPAEAAERHGHTVEFYDTDAELVSSIIQFLFSATAEGATAEGATAEGATAEGATAEGATAEGAAIVVADRVHRDGLRAALTSSGIDVDQAVADGRLVELDAVQTMAHFVREGGAVDAAAFHETIGGVLDDAARADGAVRVYGEMVAVLWHQGQINTAMRIEQLWNELAQSRTFALLCGYPAGLFTHPGAAKDFEGICQHHTDVVLAPSQQSGDDPPSHGWLGPVQWALPAALTSGAKARERLRDLLSAWRLDDVLGAAELLTTELVNNAVVHARSQVTVRIAHRDELLRVEVSDRGQGMPQRRDSGVEDTSGRGLMLVEAMSSAWGTGAHGGRKTVWFELPTGAAL